MSQPTQVKQHFQPATWGGLVLWLHILCGGLSVWPSANNVPNVCSYCRESTEEDNWKLLYERIT